jgi:uncharacterized membrane protein
LSSRRRAGTLSCFEAALSHVGFLLLRASGLYGDPNSWQVQPGGMVATVIDFLNVTKYPPSLFLR